MNMMVAMYDKKDIDTKKRLRAEAEDFTKSLF